MITWRPVLPLVIAAALAMVVPAPLVVAIAVSVIVMLLCLVDVLLAGSLAGLRCTRDGDRQIRLGEQATVTLRVSNRGSRLVRAEIRDAWVPSAGALDGDALDRGALDGRALDGDALGRDALGRDAPSGYAQRINLPPGTTAELPRTLLPTRRGDRAAVRVSIRSYGPLRLAYRQYPVGLADRHTPQWTVRVLPPFTSRKFLPEKLARLRVLDGVQVVRGRGSGTEFDTLREYVVGDDVRSIDWRASARRSDVVVRTWRPERDRRVVCVLDTGRTCATRIGDTPRLDWAIDAALLLGTLAHHAGDQVDLLAIDTTVRATVRSGATSGLLPRLAQAMAPLEPALVETDFELVTGEILRRERKRALVVLFTALEPGMLAEGLLPVLAQLTARHTVLLAAVHDPEITALAQGRGDATATYTAAAGARTLAERRRLMAALARDGVHVVDAPAEVFASRVADTYLLMKAAGRL